MEIDGIRMLIGLVIGITLLIMLTIIPVPRSGLSGAH